MQNTTNETLTADEREQLDRLLEQLDAEDILRDVDAFLSGTTSPPAQALEPAYDTSDWSVPREHPDTIALRECRAELESSRAKYDLYKQAALSELSSARAERVELLKGNHPAPKPPAVPEAPALPGGWKATSEGIGGLGIGFLSWEQLRALLATQGLHIVDAKDRAEPESEP